MRIQKERTTLAIIPAREGSKGIPQKNIADLAGKPLLAWTIQEALASNCLDRVIVSTENDKFADIARKYGAEVPFLRPNHLAGDHIPGIEAAVYTVGWLEEKESYCPEYIVYLQPTTPLRKAKDIDNACMIALENHADAVVSVTRAVHHPYQLKLIDNAGQLRDYVELKNKEKQRQDFFPVYAVNGAIYLVKRKCLLKNNSWYTERTLPYVMPLERSLDIDNSWDLQLANLIMSRHMEGKKISGGER